MLPFDSTAESIQEALKGSYFLYIKSVGESIHFVNLDTMVEIPSAISLSKGSDNQHILVAMAAGRNYEDHCSPEQKSFVFTGSIISASIDKHISRPELMKIASGVRARLEGWDG